MKKKGFSLIEILTVVAIIGILASITSYVFSSSLIRSRDTQRKTDLDTIKNALEQFYLEYRTYPPAAIPQGAGSISLVAKIQLEESIADCGERDRRYLAPFFIPTIPEDPRNKIDRNRNCNQLVMGQYLYLPELTSSGAPDPRPSYYFLAARVENSNNVNGFNLITDYARNLGQNYLFCDSTAVANCTHNYFVRSGTN